MGIEVRRAELADLDAVVDVHMQAFRGFLLTKLGRGVVRRYYDTVLHYANGVILVAADGAKVVGFASGFAKPDHFARALRRRAVGILPHVLLGIMRHPEVAWTVMQNAAAVLRARPVGYQPDPRDFELSSVGVLPETQGKGVGRALVQAIVSEARRHGVPGVYLYTDAEDNERAKRLYTAAGFVLQAGYTATGGRQRYYYRLSFENAPSSL